jgi:hypothetical protein
MKGPAAGDEHPVVVLEALDYASGQMLCWRRAQNGEPAFSAVREDLAPALPAGAPAVLVLATAGYHNSAELRACWQQHADQVQPFWLPASTPQVHLLARVGRSVQQQLAGHRWWNELDRLIQATDTILTGRAFHGHATIGPAFRSVQTLCESA